MMTVVIPLMLAWVAVGGGVVLALQWKWLKILRQDHNTVWEELGKPVLIGDSVRDQIRLFGFVKSGKFRQLNDAEFEKLTVRMVSVGAIYVFVFFVLVAAFAVSLY